MHHKTHTMSYNTLRFSFFDSKYLRCPSPNTRNRSVLSLFPMLWPNHCYLLRLCCDLWNNNFISGVFFTAEENKIKQPCTGRHWRPWIYWDLLATVEAWMLHKLLVTVEAHLYVFTVRRHEPVPKQQQQQK